MAIDWTRGYQVAAWRLFQVNRDTWADGDEVGGLYSATVNSDAEDPTIQHADLTVDAAVGERLESGYYRIAMTAQQGGETERVDVATLLCESTSDIVDRGYAARTVVGQSVLHPASTDKLAIGSYAPSGVDGAEYAAELLRASINAPVVVQGSFTLDSPVVFDGCSVLDAVRLILKAGSFALHIDGYGRVVISPAITEPALILDNAGARLLQPTISRSLDYSGVPNVYRVTQGTQMVEVVNDDPSSPTSTVTRGWRNVETEDNPIRVNGETLGGYAERMLEEKSTVPDSRTYAREWWPDVYVGSLVRGTIASVGIDGLFRVDSQRFTCDKGITVEEQASREVVTWQRG